MEDVKSIVTKTKTMIHPTLKLNGDHSSMNTARVFAAMYRLNKTVQTTNKSNQRVNYVDIYATRGPRLVLHW